MEEIETNEQALAWCQKYGASVNFLNGIRVYVDAKWVGEGKTFLEAVNNAELFLYAEVMRSQALNDLEGEQP
jgi:hypothetical protein